MEVLLISFTSNSVCDRHDHILQTLAMLSTMKRLNVANDNHPTASILKSGHLFYLPVHVVANYITTSSKTLLVISQQVTVAIHLNIFWD